MRGRNAKEDEDSGSDWDSMSEMDPVPKKEKKQISNQNQPIPAPLKLKSMTFVDPHVRAEENPPYNFKPEIKTPSRIAEEKQTKPGRQKKGKTYDPPISQEKHVTFKENEEDNDKHSANGNLGGQESDSEDPLYSTVKPKSVQQDHVQSQPKRESEEEGNKGKPKMRKKMPKMPLKSSVKKTQGVDNEGFVGDDEYDTSVMPSGFKTPLGPILKKPASTVIQSPEQKTDTRMNQRLSPIRQPQAVSQFQSSPNYEAQQHPGKLYECPPPLVLTVGETVLESAGKRPVELTNRALGELFSFITFPFTCFALFFHHLLRFFLLGLARPLFIDSLILIVEYLLQPFVTGVIRPLLLHLNAASVSLSETLVVCVRPITTVLQSIRLVEINYTRKYSIEEI